MVFDEEQLEALLESVLIHIELYLHPKRGMERWAETKREREIRNVQEVLQVTEEMKYLFYGVMSRDRREERSGGLGDKNGIEER